MAAPVAITMSSEGKFTDVDFVQWIMNEIEDKVFKRQQVADTYAILIRKGHKDFKAINEAILKRWSMSGLLWIKTQAWKQLNAPAATVG
jgi:hypothetical protein